MTSKVFSNRAAKLQLLLKEWNVEGCLIENPLDLFYLTGLQLSAGALVVSRKNCALFVDGRYIEFAKKNSPFPVHLLDKLSFTPTMAFDSHSTTFDRWEKLSKTKLTPISQPLKTIRAIKEKDELKALEKSAKLLWKGFEHIRRKLKVGVTEKEIACELEVFWLQHGAEATSFDPIIAFGKNSAYPHYRAGDTKLKKGDIVLCDIGVVLDHYHSDMTRTFFSGSRIAV